MKNAAPTDVSIHDLLTQRWSPRAIDPERPVATADLRELAPRTRRPVKEIAFAGDWDRPFPGS